MNSTVDKTRDLLPALLDARAGRSDDRLQPLRRQAAESFAKLGFPAPDDEQWRYTNVAPLSRIEYRLPSEAGALDIGTIRLGDASAELVFVNGKLSTPLSRLGASGAKVGLLSQLGDESLIAQLGRVASSEEHPFVALNTGMFDDVAVVYVPAGVTVKGPVHIIYASSGNGEPVVTSPRTLIVTDTSARVSVIETYVGREGQYLTNAVTEVVAGPGSSIDYYKLERESEGATHVGMFATRIERDASVFSHVISLGGRLVRNELHALLDGEGGECNLDGLYILNGEQRVDNHTVIEHAKPHTTSTELYKGILDGSSNGIFDGKIVVHAGAQKTSSRQTNKNLVLSNQAVADSKPQLEIYADDVKCNHGSTIGQLDPESLFYLRSRGVGLAQARNILTYAFASEVVERMALESIREQLKHDILLRVPFNREEAP